MCYFAGYWNCLFKHDVFSLFALVFWFRVYGNNTIWFGRRAESNKNAFRFQKQSVFSKKPTLEQGWLHHKRTRPLNRQERQCVDEKFELQMPKFVFRTTNVSKTLGTLCSSLRDTFKSEETTPVICTWTKKKTDLFNILFFWAQTSLEKIELFEEDFFPPLWEECCVRSTVFNTKLLPRWKDGFVL